MGQKNTGRIWVVGPLDKNIQEAQRAAKEKALD